MPFLQRSNRGILGTLRAGLGCGPMIFSPHQNRDLYIEEEARHVREYAA